MQLVKTIDVKVVSIAPGKVRPTAQAVMAARAAQPAKGKDAKAVADPNAVKDGIAITLGAVDGNGRTIGRAILNISEGKMIVGSDEVGSAPTALNTALTTAFAEIEKAVSALLQAGKISV